MGETTGAGCQLPPPEFEPLPLSPLLELELPLLSRLPPEPESEVLSPLLDVEVPLLSPLLRLGRVVIVELLSLVLFWVSLLPSW